MSNPFKYLNNILYGLSEGTSLLIKFYETKNIQIGAEAMIKGGHKSILLAHLSDQGLLPHVDLAPFFKMCDAFDEICYEEPDESGMLSIQKTLNNINLVFEGWSNLYNGILEITILELKLYEKELILLNDNQLKDYCYKLLDYEHGYYNPKYLDHFIILVHKHIQKI